MMHRGPGARKHPGRVGQIGRAGSGVLACAFLVLAGCPSRFDPRAETLSSLGQARGADPAIDAAWRQARARFDAGDLDGARQAFAALRTAGGPVAAPATLWEARSLLALGGAEAARSLVEPLATARPGDGEAEQVASAARFLLGLSLARLGEAARARQLLEPLASSIADGEDAVELHAALASSAAALGDAPVALREWERFFDGARPAERAFVRDRSSQLAAGLGEAEVRGLWISSPSGSLARAVLSERVAALSAEPTGAASLRAEGMAARARFGFPSPMAVSSSAAPAALRRAVGLVLPLSGRNRLLGERALRGAMLAAGVLPPGDQPRVELLVRDSGSRPEVAVAAVDELASAGVAFVVLSPDRAEAAAAASRAEALSIPAFDLSLDEGAGSPGRFRLLRPNGNRAAALAAHARKAGARRFAALYPDSAYGRRMAEAFVQAVQSGGGAVVAQLHFDEKSTTFIAPGKRLAELQPDAIFVPAAASQLELIAAQLATLGVLRTASGRGALLCATADGAGARTLQNAGRYLQGAALAPVFLGGDEETAPRLQAYRAAFGEEPGAADALGYDAVEVAAQAVARLPPDPQAVVAGRRALLQLVASGALAPDGLTGPLRFQADGQRGGSPRLFTIEGDRVKVLP